MSSDTSKPVSALLICGGGCRVTLDASAMRPRKQELNLVALNDALGELSRVDQQQATIVELRYFAGLSIQDTSDVLEISLATVKRTWANARFWSRRDLSQGTL